MIKAEIVAHSLSPQGDELMSVLATFPRIILAEVNTHRMLSKNTSSSRAIPFNKMVETVENNPFIPIAWQREHSGMQGTKYLEAPIDIAFANDMWLEARDRAVKSAKAMSKSGTDGKGFVTKQLCNRLLEPFMWTTMLITGSKEGWDNFFRLRCPSYRIGGRGDEKSSVTLFKSKKDAIQQYPGSVDEPDINWMLWNEGQAEIHIMDLAEKIWDARNESTPRKLLPGQWHIPFQDKMLENTDLSITNIKLDVSVLIKSSVAMAARTSYTVVGDEKAINYENMIALHDRLLNQEPPHSSPFEHTARAMNDEEFYTFYKGKVEASDNTIDRAYNHLIVADTDEQEKGYGWCYNLKGFIPYRYLVDNKINL